MLVSVTSGDNNAYERYLFAPTLTVLYYTHTHTHTHIYIYIYIYIYICIYISRFHPVG